MNKVQLFHYHWWTGKVEEMENFYFKLGFQVTLRAAKRNGEIETFNPPLTWDDFRNKELTFRIIEMRKGQTNITFGNGKKDMFDHMGFLVDELEYKQIIERANEANWKVNEGDRRTFISTPWGIRIELQKNNNVVTNEPDTIIDTLEINLPFNAGLRNLADFLALQISENNHSIVKMENQNFRIVFLNRPYTNMNSVVFRSNDVFDNVDPVNTRLITKHMDRNY